MQRVMGLLAVLLFAAGCTTQRVALESVTPAPRVYSAVVVGEISAARPEMGHLAGFFRTGFIEQMREEGFTVYEEGVSEISDEEGMPRQEDAFWFGGELKEIDTGSAAARWIVGFGAGAQKLHGVFELKSIEGTLLTAWSSREKYSGGAGMGGAQLISLEEFAKSYGKHTAERVARWARREPIEGPSS